MDPNNAISSDHDVQPSYINQQLYQIGDDIGSYLKNPAVCRGIGKNGKYDDGEYDYTDIGPETDVDAGEDVHGNNYPLATSSSLEPSPENEKTSPVETNKFDDDGKNDNDYSCDNANVCPVDSVANEGDIDNCVRPSEKDVRGADDEMPRDNDDNARVETADTLTVVDDDESPSSPRAAKRQHELIVADNVADSEDSEDEWDFYRVDPNKHESAAAAVSVDKSCKDIEDQSTLESEFAKDEIASKAEKDIKCEKLVKAISSELIDINVSDKSSEQQKDQILLNFQEDKKDQDNMEFQLNPEAAEFVPSPPLRNNRSLLKDFAISGSPLKQTQAMDDIPIPSQSEFDKEMSHRPKEIGEEFSHDEHANLQNNGSQNMDTSEISSTKAEVGDDESIMNVMSASHWQGTNTSQWLEKADDDTETDSDESEVAETCEPSSPKIALNNTSKKKKKSLKDQDIDLNAVHMLDDSSDGAELVSTPPRSPEPYANENRAHTPFSEDKNSIDALCASTPQFPDDVLSAVSSEVNSEATATRPAYESKASKALFAADQDPLAKEAARISPGASLEDFHISTELPTEGRQKNDSLVDLKKSVKELDEEHVKIMEDEDKEKSCKIDDIEKFFFVPQNCSQKVENERMETEVPKVLPDSTNYFNSNNYSNSNTKNNQNLFDLETPLYKNLHLDSALEREQLNYRADLVTDMTNAKDPFAEIVKQESQISESTNWVEQSENTTNKSPSLKFSFENNPFAESTEQKVDMFYNKDKDGSDENAKPDTTADLNPFNSIQKFNVENELHHNQIFEGHVSVEATTIDKPVEQAEKKAAELTPTIDDVLEEKPASDGVFLKERETEPQETAIAPSRDTATIDISKEAVETIEVLGVAAVATAATAAVAMKAKAAATSITKRPTKTVTTKATTSATKTVTKSMPTSPSKTTTAATRTVSSAQAVAKKSATSTTPRSKQDGSNKLAVSGASGKTTATKTTTTAVKTTSTLTKTGLSPRVSSGTTKPKTTTVSSKNSGTPNEKKSTLSGDTKPISKPATARTTSTSSRTTTGTIAKTTLAKTSLTSTKTSASGVTLKLRPAPLTSIPKAALTSKPATTGVNGAPRPRTAPTSGTTKPREIVGRTMPITTKSPLIDKQSKETVNKQISRSGASAPKVTNRASVPALGVTKTRALPAKPASTLPAKKPPVSKTAPKTSAVTKRVSSNENTVLQNGIAKEDVTQAAVITTTTKPEDDVPRKDASPVNVQTDNQLIAN